MPQTAHVSKRSRVGAPPQALLLSLMALAVPVIGTYFLPEWTSREAGLLLWLLALVPPFLLSYHCGWKGASTALAGAMAAYALAQVVVIQRDAPPPPVVVLFGVTVSLIAVSLGAGILAAVLKGKLRETEQMALTDAATGLPNLRFAMLHLDRAFAAAERGAPLTLVLFNLDNLGQVNDRWGRGAGDDALRAFVRTLSELTREMHLSARLDGGTFVSILDSIDMKGAEVFAERVLDRLRKADAPWGPISASAGLAEYESGMTHPDVLLAKAEEALYRAKTRGGDRTLVLERADTGPAVDRNGGRHPRRAAKEAGFGAGETVLVVDDDAGVLRVLVPMLRRAGYRALSASTPEQAERLAREHLGGVDLVVVDLVMPGMNGFALVEMIERSRGSIPALYISGYDRSEIPWSSVPGEPKAFLGKPLEMKPFLRKVRDLLDRTIEVDPQVPATAAAPAVAAGGE